MSEQNQKPTGVEPSKLTASEAIQQLEQNIGQALIGQKKVVSEIVIGLIAAGHILIEGVPGLGKTLLARALAQSVSGSFSRIQFTPDLMPGDITGHVMFDMNSSEFRVIKGPVFCHILLADEINRAPAKTQSALLEVMQEQQVTIEGKPYPTDAPFLVMATQNPIEQEGTYPLPEAQLDRFLLKVLIDYPTSAEESDLVHHVTSHSVGDKLNLSAVKKLLSPGDVLALQQQAAELKVDRQVLNYAVKIIRTTRSWSGISIGAGPRGGIALIRAARAKALINGNDFVTPDEIKAVTPAVLRHRINLTADMEIEGITRNDVIQDLLDAVEAPRV